MKSQERRKSVLILTDEPTGKFDTRTSVEIMELFCELNDKSRKSKC